MPDRFPDLVFGGGGTRCFWQGGFMAVARERFAPTRRINAVSGGVLSALAHITRQGPRLLDLMGRRFDEIAEGRGNASLTRRRRGGPLLIHQDLYRGVVAELMSAPGAVEAVADGPDFMVQLAVPGRAGILPTLLTYAAEVPLGGTPHVRATRLLGARPLMVDGRQAARDRRIVELTVIAASSPPAFDRFEWDGVPVMDGGTVDNAPPHEGSPDQLLLVTRPYRNLPDLPGRTYAAPSRKVPTNKLDFTDREGIEATWAQGEDDGRAFLDTVMQKGQADRPAP